MRNYFTEEQEKIIIELYTKEHRGQLYCAKAVGSTNVNKVKEVLKKNKIEIRDFSHAATLSNQNRAYNKDENYFDNQSSNMAWLLGFLASDGSVSSSDNSIKIGLSSIDKDILEIIKEELKIENKIKDYTTRTGFNVSELVWSSAKHKRILAEYGITPQKTFTLKPPTKLEKQYWIDFIRGYFDGDGSINLLSQGALRWQICGASQEILQWIIDVLYEEYNIPKVKLLCQQRKTPYYYFQYSTNSTKKIFEILYTKNAIYLPRKKKHFESILQMK